MDYEINGRQVTPVGECGVYKETLGGISMDYAVMDPALLAQRINSLLVDEAIQAVTALRDKAAEQAKWKNTPQNLGFPILRQTPGPLPIEEVRGNIRNTRNFCDNILRALKGE